MPSHTFSRSERLKSRKAIAEIFDSGELAKAYPILLRYRLVPRTEAAAQMAFTVPKRSFRKAAHRNRIKRRVREAYRLSKHLIAVPEDKCLQGMMIYTGRSEESYYKIEKAVNKIIQYISALDTQS